MTSNSHITNICWSTLCASPLVFSLTERDNVKTQNAPRLTLWLRWFYNWAAGTSSNTPDFFFRRGPETTPINKDVHISDWTAVVQRAHAPHRTSCVQLETAWFLSYTLSSAHLRLGFLLTQSILWLLSRFLNVDKAPYLPALASTNITICRSLLLESITFAV